MSDRRLASDAAGVRLPPLAALPDVLAWHQDAMHPGLWRDAFDSRLRWLVDQVGEKDDQSGALSKNLALLSPNQRQRFLRVPVVARLLCSPFATSRCEMISDHLEAELARLGLAATLQRSAWTPRGDRYLDLAARSDWTEAERTLTNTHITVDLRSSFEFPDDALGLSDTTPHPSHETTPVLQRLRQSIAALSDHCPPARELVTTMIEVLALRRSGGITGLGSATFDEYPGLVRLANVHLHTVKLPHLNQALVHEAIHCFLHVHEELTGRFVPDDPGDLTIASPWTGAPLKLQTYVHACAVWYGVYWLWSAQPPAEGDEALVEGLQRLAKTGFLRRPVSNGLGPLCQLLSDSARELLDELEQRMLAVA
jgi:hypothetical protein